MPKSSMRALLTDIGTEELAHMEIVGSMVRQLLNKPEYEELANEYAPNYVEHGLAVYPMNAAGIPFDANALQSKGDPITDIAEDMAAEQKARATYEYLLDMADDPDVIAPLRFLREREIVHFQRFGEVMDYLNDLNEQGKLYIEN